MLLGVLNVNVTDDQVSLWRRTKKATTRAMQFTFRFLKSLTAKGKSGNSEDAGATATRGNLQRMQTRASIYTVAEDDDAIQMTPVPSPAPTHDRFSFSPSMDERSYPAPPALGQSATSTAQIKPSPPSGKFYGSVVDPTYNRKQESSAMFRRDNWKNVRVGDWVRIYNNDQVPADMVILATSDADGACYVETKNLDGETNLKVRHALHCGGSIKHARDCENSKFTIESEGPHANLYAYTGLLKWDQVNANDPNKHPVPMTEPISVNNLLLRGCSLRNTDWAIGVVIFTGSETKIMMNAGITPTKRSRIQRELNVNVSFRPMSPRPCRDLGQTCNLISDPTNSCAGFDEFYHLVCHVLAFWYSSGRIFWKERCVAKFLRIWIYWWFSRRGRCHHFLDGNHSLPNIGSGLPLHQS